MTEDINHQDPGFLYPRTAEEIYIYIYLLLSFIPHKNGREKRRFLRLLRATGAAKAGVRKTIPAGKAGRAAASTLPQDKMAASTWPQQNAGRRPRRCLTFFRRGSSPSQLTGMRRRAPLASRAQLMALAQAHQRERSPSFLPPSRQATPTPRRIPAPRPDFLLGR